MGELGCLFGQVRINERSESGEMIPFVYMYGTFVVYYRLGEP